MMEACKTLCAQSGFIFLIRRSAVIGFLLLCSTTTHAALRCVWKEMHAIEKDACFRAKEFNHHGVQCWDFTEFKSQSFTPPRGSYKDFYREGQPADLIVGTACVGNGIYRDVCLPSARSVVLSLENLQDHLVLLFGKKRQDAKAWDGVLGLYSPGAALGMEHHTPYIKIPYTHKGVTSLPIMSYAQKIPKFCLMVSDVFSTGMTEFNALRLFLDDVLPPMTDAQKGAFRVGITAAYLDGERSETVVCFDGTKSCLYVVRFKGNMLERLLICEQLHLLGTFLQKQENRYYKQLLHGASAEARNKVLQTILDVPSFKAMAYERYNTYIKYCFVQVHLNDVFRLGWIDAASADAMQIIMPRMSVSAHKGLDLQPIAQYLSQEKGINYLLEPIFYLRAEHMVLCSQAADHAQIAKERTGFPHEHEAPVLTLNKDAYGHYHIEGDWTRCCHGLSELGWVDCDKTETVGVILFDPYGSSDTRLWPTQDSHPQLLADIMADMERDLHTRGFNVLFLQLFPDGQCQDTHGKPYPRAKPKSPISDKLFHETVRVVWDDNDLLQRRLRYAQ